MRSLFPRPSPWIEFTSHDDFLQYVSKDDARWPGSYSEGVEGLRQLVESKAAEPQIQEFLEAHPYLLPGFDRLHHGPYEGIVATKFALGTSFQTDFAFVSSNSQTLCLTAVEIESSRKRLFRKDGRFSRDYFDAKQQIVDWLFWAQHHVRDALDAWGYLLRGITPKCYDIRFRGYLVFGRRAELDDPVKKERWASEASSLDARLAVMTYDRLLQLRSWLCPDIDNERIIVCSFKDRRFHVKKVCC